jgi:RNA polymerase sigma factor (sigma-70 family)
MQEPDRPEQAFMVSSELLPIVQSAYERSQRRYPTVDLSFASFRARIEEILAAAHREHGEDSVRGGEDRESIRCPACLSQSQQLHHEDLFLALACAEGDRIAWECFAEEYLALLRRYAMRACRSCDASEDLAHDIVASLLGDSMGAVESPEDRPQPGGSREPPQHPAAQGKLRSYNGRGSLAGWLRAAVSHAAVDRFRRGRKQVSLDELLEQGSLAGPADNQGAGGVESLDAHWGPVLARALEVEISRLGARDRRLISLYYYQGVSLKDIGRQFGVHEATASRWLERLRSDIRKRVERELRKRHGLSARDLASLWPWACEGNLPESVPVLQPAPADNRGRKKMQGGSP